MVQIKDATDKLKKIVAGATLMAGIAMGTGCDNAQQQLQKNPTEDVVNDNDTDGNYANDENTDKPSENNDTDKTSENNDSDKPIEHDDSEKPVENNDTDKPIENNDNDDIINDNDTDINNPDETNDDDVQSDECATENIAASAQYIANHSPEEVQTEIEKKHERCNLYCNGTISKKEWTDKKGNYCIENECSVNLDEIIPEGEIIWIDDLITRIYLPEVPPPHEALYYKKVEHLNKGGPTDLILKQRWLTIYVKNVPTVSCFQPNNIIDNASTNTMIVGDGCYSNGQSISTSNIVTKNIQPKINDSEFREACNKVPNSTYSKPEKQCYTTITEFAWLENVAPYLHNKNYAQWGYFSELKTNKIEKDLNNDVFYMYLSSGGGMFKWVVELPNAKRCLDECYGIEGCEVSIKPNPDLSNGCIVKEPENASLMRPNTKNKTPLMAKQKKQARVNTQKLPKRNLAVSRVAQSLARHYTR